MTSSKLEDVLNTTCTEFSWRLMRPCHGTHSIELEHLSRLGVAEDECIDSDRNAWPRASRRRGSPASPWQPEHVAGVLNAQHDERVLESEQWVLHHHSD